jgi:dTDP-4-dehydrorhamnose reductase
MSSRAILVFGKHGQVGYELCRTLGPLGPIVAIDYPEVNLADATSIRNWIRQTEPAMIVNAAAYTAVDKAESEPELAMSINGDAPRIMAEEAARLKALLVHYSTDYVFDGKKTEPYHELDAPNPLSVYGQTKLAGERGVQEVDGDYLLFRLCWVYGARGQNFMRTMVRLAGEREQLRVVSDQVGSPTWSRMIAEVTALVLARALDPAARASKGIYHLSASGHTSWHGFAEAVLARTDPAKRKCRKIAAIPTSEYPLPAKRPANSVFSCEKLKQMFGLALPRWDESLNFVLENASSPIQSA